MQGKYREFRPRAQIWRAASVEMRAGSKAWNQIPHSAKQGIFEQEQGNKLAASGILAPISGRAGLVGRRASRSEGASIEKESPSPQSPMIEKPRESAEDADSRPEHATCYGSAPASARQDTPTRLLLR